jgi:integration host factor subunit beta
MTKSELDRNHRPQAEHLPAKDVELAVKHMLETDERRARQRPSASRSGASAASRCISARRAWAATPRPARRWRWPGKYVPHFKPGKDLRERVNEMIDRRIAHERCAERCGHAAWPSY